MLKKLFSCLLVCSFVLLAGCQTTIPKDALALKPTSLEDRHLQTRTFDTHDEELVLSAVAGVLQDLGFTIEESESRLGFISASKDRDATQSGQVAAAVLIALLGGGAAPIDKNQKMRAAIVVSRNPVDLNMRVRVTFQRKVWNTQNQVTKAETLKQPEFYQEFYEKLSKALFLEGQQI